MSLLNSRILKYGLWFRRICALSDIFNGYNCIISSVRSLQFAYHIFLNKFKLYVEFSVPTVILHYDIQLIKNKKKTFSSIINKHTIRHSF